MEILARLRRQVVLRAASRGEYCVLSQAGQGFSEVTPVSEIA